jgi:hypothetical protein
MKLHTNLMKFIDENKFFKEKGHYREEELKIVNEKIMAVLSSHPSVVEDFVEDLDNTVKRWVRKRWPL